MTKSHITGRHFLLAVCVGCSLFGGASQAANPINFRDVDYAEGDGSDIYLKDLQLIGQIAPKGTSVGEAARSLVLAGARPVKPDAAGMPRFVYYSTETIEDIQHDVALTITLNQRDGVVNRVNAERVSYGS